MLRNYLKYLPPFQQFLIFIGITIGISAVALLIATPIIHSFTGVPISALEDLQKGIISHPGMKNYLIISQTISVIFIFIIPAYLFAYFADPQPTHFLGLHKFPAKNIAIWIVPLVFLGIYGTSVFGYLNQLIPLPKGLVEGEAGANKAVELMATAQNIPDLLMSIIVVGLLAAISEEIFFRGVMQRIIIHITKNAWLGIIITATLFSIFHFQFTGFLPRMALGIILGALYWYSGSLWATIAFHFLHNFLGIIAEYITKNNSINKVPNSNNEIAIFIYGIAALIAIYFVFKNISKKSTANFAALYPEKPNFFEE